MKNILRQRAHEFTPGVEPLQKAHGSFGSGMISGTFDSEEQVQRYETFSLMKAQAAAVAEYPEFQGNVAYVCTKSFWRPQEQSPSGQGYHWNSNAETYCLIGDAMGYAMRKLLVPAPE